MRLVLSWFVAIGMMANASKVVSVTFLVTVNDVVS